MSTTTTNQPGQVCWLDEKETGFADGCTDATRTITTDENGKLLVSVVNVPDKNHMVHYEMHDDHMYAHAIYLKDTRFHNHDTTFTFIGKCANTAYCYDEEEGKNVDENRYTLKCDGLLVPSYVGTNDNNKVAEQCTVYATNDLSRVEYQLTERLIKSRREEFTPASSSSR